MVSLLFYLHPFCSSGNKCSSSNWYILCQQWYQSAVSKEVLSNLLVCNYMSFRTRTVHHCLVRSSDFFHQKSWRQSGLGSFHFNMHSNIFLDNINICLLFYCLRWIFYCPQSLYLSAVKSWIVQWLISELNRYFYID